MSDLKIGQSHGDFTNTWPALMVQKVDEKQIRWNAAGRISLEGLPIQQVQLPMQDPFKIAILSWRWDFIREGKQSTNLTVAIRYAKRVGIEHILIDVVSIDQTLLPEPLVDQVFKFSDLFKTIQVIAAYDTAADPSTLSMKRPWIVHECAAIQQNTFQVIHVSHRLDFTSRVLETSSISMGEAILCVLAGTTSMTSIADFRYLLPPFSSILSIAYEKLCSKDYLLTTALLYFAEASKDLSTRRWTFKTGMDVLTRSDLGLEQYSFQKREELSEGENFTWSILLNGKTVADWLVRRECCIMRVLPDAEHLISTMLGMPNVQNEAHVLGICNRHISFIPVDRVLGRNWIKDVVVDLRRETVRDYSYNHHTGQYWGVVEKGAYAHLL